jgi:activator of 2-hydroxyglutaryl-CoA dehydratase/predicted nucleotide-binding protein (sugar kinase/HSP70/actin superfamily)
MSNHNLAGVASRDDSTTPRSLAEEGSGSGRFLGIDIGAETIKVVELERQDGVLRWTRRRLLEHGKQPGPVLQQMLRELDWDSVEAAAVSGRLSRQVRLPRVPTKQAQAKACQYLLNGEPTTVVSIGSHGFSVLELRASRRDVFRENSRCSQGTGNFLRQLTERFGLSVAEASDLCAEVQQPAPLSGRCPVILKTDMTHLANKGEDRARILAGLFDAVCANVLVLLKPQRCPAQVVLIGGVSRSRRVERAFARHLAAHGMNLKKLDADDGLFFEALGSALVAAEQKAPVPDLERLLVHRQEMRFERVPALVDSLGLVRRMPVPPGLPSETPPRSLILGFDMGSTGSKLLAMDPASRAPVWQGYRRTSGDPVGAAQALLRQFVEGPYGAWPVAAIGVTGSGREIVGSLLTTCYGAEVVFILNEIVAHAEGALHYDPRVDTIFEIGGQDAKYIRLAGGRVVDCAMNEACSAGTGSFIEEQGSKFASFKEVTELAQQALGASWGVSLGQHCSVFMAEVIDEAIAAGIDEPPIMAGLYDSIIQNYLNRVKGARSVGEVIFCQGMPFSAEALAAAVARQTGAQVIIPPNPGLVGALGIALLTAREVKWESRARLDPGLFLDARVESKDAFVCKSTVGCGGAGNKCRIDTLKTVVSQRRQSFNWGGCCSLYDKGVRKRKLPDRAPDPFREREELVQGILRGLPARPGARRIALTDEFALKGLAPFFAVYLYELGCDVVFHTKADQAVLKRGIQEGNVPYCAPMQLYYGLLSQMAGTEADLLFAPMVRTLARVADEKLAKTCPIVQAGPDIIRWSLPTEAARRIVSPIIDVGPGDLESEEFLESCRRSALELGVNDQRWREAWAKARTAQTRFEVECLEIGRRALAFCGERQIAAVVVLGRPYTVYNTVLNSNVPALLREQGAIGIPLDCYPVDKTGPVYQDMYWAYGQRILRAAHQVRRQPGVYSLYASNYSCGPDSFNLHFYSYIMEGKPFAIIETDGHSGDAGTKTRTEAFLHCAYQDLKQGGPGRAPTEFRRLALAPTSLDDLRAGGRRILIPSMGHNSETLEVCFRGLGLDVECLPRPDRDTVRLGRRYTSGKECLPMCVTLGGLLQRLHQESDPARRFAYLMPRAQGPCRFGIYNLLNQVVLDRLAWRERVHIWTPAETGYFDCLPAGFKILLLAGVMAGDYLFNALLQVRPVETRPGAAQQVYDRCRAGLLALLEKAAGGNLSTRSALWQVAGGRLFGIRKLLRRAAGELAAIRGEREIPTVLVVGEIYVRCEPFSNDHVIGKLEQRGLRVWLAPFHEWLDYVAHLNCEDAGGLEWGPRVDQWVQRSVQLLTYGALGRRLGWPKCPSIPDTLHAAEPYIRSALHGEAVLTVGGPTHEWRAGQIDAVVSVGPLECMPNKIAEAQFYQVGEHEGLLSLTLSLNGDPVDEEILDSFAFEVHSRSEHRRAGKTGGALRQRRASPKSSPLEAKDRGLLRPK